MRGLFYRGIQIGALLTLVSGTFGCAAINDLFSGYGQERLCQDAYGNTVPCSPTAYRDDRRCFNSRGSDIYCRPGDAARPHVSGSARPVVAPPRYPYNLRTNRAVAPGYEPDYGQNNRPRPIAPRRAVPRYNPYTYPAYGQPYEPAYDRRGYREPRPRPQYGPYQPSNQYGRYDAPHRSAEYEPYDPGGYRPAPDTPGRGGFVLGVGDVINVAVFGQPDMSTQAVISDSGFVTLPLLGPINLDGLTPLQAERKITGALRRGDYLVNPQVNVTLEEYRSRQISVLGQVQQPGRITLERDLTPLDAIAAASGTTPEAGHFAVLVREGPGGEQRQVFDLRRNLRGPDGLPMVVLDGDTIFVPENSSFYIYGQVNNPAQYPIEPGLTVLQALSLGGGLTERASVKKVSIRRRAPDGLLRSFQAKLDDLVMPGDVVFVDEGLF